MFSAPATIDIPLDNGTVWHVTNAEGSGYGSMTLESATINSVNTVYAQLIEQLGADKVVETAKRMGLRCCTRVSRAAARRCSPTCRPCSARTRSNTLEMSSAYGTLATGGQHVNPIPVIRVADANGNVLWAGEPATRSRWSIRRSPRSPNEILAGGRALRHRHAPPTSAARRSARPGTADTHTNAWFVGSLPQLDGRRVGGVPARRDPDGAAAPRRITVFGGTWPAQIWRLFMLKAAAGLPVRSFPTPDVGYVSVAVDVTQDPYCLPNPYTLAAEHRLPRVHRRHRADEDVHDADLAPDRDRSPR